MPHTVQGLILIDTHVSILNNLGKDDSTTYENSVAVKKIKKENRYYTYASGQAYRNWLRTTLGREFNWPLSPIIREKKIAHTEANPVEHPDDDLFGYMKASSKQTLTRLSPFKNSAFISVSPVHILNDFKVMARQEGDAVPYSNQPYSTILKGIISIDIDSVGTFNTVHKTGYLNCSEEYVKEHSEYLEVEEDPFFYINKNEKHKRYRLKKEERLQRVSDLLLALNKISGGASQTSHLTDLSPKFLILSAIEGGNHIFSHVVYENEDGRCFFDPEALREILKDYKDELKSPVFIGRRKGFKEEWNKELLKLAEEKLIVYGSPVEITKQFITAKEYQDLY